MSKPHEETGAPMFLHFLALKARALQAEETMETPESEHRGEPGTGKRRLTNPTALTQVVVQAIWSDRRATATVAVGDEPSMNSHESCEDCV
jgi:hypothetical protein